MSFCCCILPGAIALPMGLIMKEGAGDMDAEKDFEYLGENACEIKLITRVEETYTVEHSKVRYTKCRGTTTDHPRMCIRLTASMACFFSDVFTYWFTYRNASTGVTLLGRMRQSSTAYSAALCEDTHDRKIYAALASAGTRAASRRQRRRAAASITSAT